jgi:bacteriorhodopsin
MSDTSSLVNSDNQLVQSSFYVTYAFLITTGTITFIESIRTPDSKIRNILNLETCISVVAAFFYGKFVSMFESQPDKPVPYKKINNTRYLDWSITTPIMLLVLILALLYNTKGGSLNFKSFLNVLIMNYGMLGAGYLGEISFIDKTVANSIGFLFFIGLFYYIYKHFVAKKYNFDNTLLYSAFLGLWTIYGVAYFYDEVTKNVVYNVLDLFSKCFVGIFFWAYYTKVFTR